MKNFEEISMKEAVEVLIENVIEEMFAENANIKEMAEIAEGRGVNGAFMSELATKVASKVYGMVVARSEEDVENMPFFTACRKYKNQLFTFENGIPKKRYENSPLEDAITSFSNTEGLTQTMKDMIAKKDVVILFDGRNAFASNWVQLTYYFTNEEHGGYVFEKYVDGLEKADCDKTIHPWQDLPGVNRSSWAKLNWVPTAKQSDVNISYFSHLLTSGEGELRSWAEDVYRWDESVSGKHGVDTPANRAIADLLKKTKI